MTYLILAAVFLALAVGVLAVALRRRPPSADVEQEDMRGRAPDVGTTRTVDLRAVALSVAVLVVMTIVFDNIMIAAGLFAFAPEHLVGVMLGRAPVEDLSYPLAAALLLPALWHLLATRGRSGPGGRGNPEGKEPS
jgi:small toxic polypeptide LdrA/B/C/D